MGRKPIPRLSREAAINEAPMMPENRIRLARNEIEALIADSQIMQPDTVKRLLRKSLAEIDKGLSDLSEVRQVLRMKLTG